MNNLHEILKNEKKGIKRRMMEMFVNIWFAASPSCVVQRSHVCDFGGACVPGTHFSDFYF